MCIFENIDTANDYDAKDLNIGKMFFNPSKTQPLIITQIMSIFNNLSRYHLNTIRFLIEKFHIGMIVWLVLNLLDSKTVNVFSALENQG